MDNFLAQFVIHYGLWGVFLLLFIENIFPVLPSELVIPVAAAAGAQMGIPLWETIFAASTGAMLGQMPWYYGARALGYARFRSFAARWGRLTTVGPEQIDRANAWFERNGQAAVFFGRVLPVVRGVISIPAGLSNMPLGRFLAWSIPGSTIWIIGLAYAGHVAGQHPRIVDLLDPLTKITVAAVGVIWLYRAVTWRADQAAGKR